VYEASYSVGDECWIYLSHHRGEKTRGVVVAVLDLVGYSARQYVIEIETGVDSLLEVRSAMTMSKSEGRPIGMYDNWDLGDGSVAGR
jgi:hypothetical protein